MHLLIKDWRMEGHPVPFVRMNNRNMWTPAVQNYLGYKGQLASLLATKYRHLVPPPPLPKVLKRDDPEGYRAYQAQQAELAETTYCLFGWANTYQTQCDWDNLAKGLQDGLADAGRKKLDKALKKTLKDALQNSGIIPNDCKVSFGSFYKSHDKDQPEAMGIHCLLKGTVAQAKELEQRTLATWLDAVTVD